MSRNKRELSSEERALWRSVAKTVRPREVGKHPLGAKHESSTPGLAARGSRLLPTHAQKAAPPSDRGGERRVRRGKLEIGATLDLHGHTQASGRVALGRFLQAAHLRGDRVVVVVTGVGRAGGGVLKARLPDWLAERELSGLVSGFAQAHRSHGGAGAYYVFLKKFFS